MKRMRFIAFLGAGMVLVLLVVAGLRGQASEADENDDRWRIERGFDIAPVPLNLEGKDRALVGLGSYLGECRCWLQ